MKLTWNTSNSYKDQLVAKREPYFCIITSVLGGLPLFYGVYVQTDDQQPGRASSKSGFAFTLTGAIKRTHKYICELSRADSTRRGVVNSLTKRANMIEGRLRG